MVREGSGMAFTYITSDKLGKLVAPFTSLIIFLDTFPQIYA